MPERVSISGFLNIDKPLRLTSHDVVNKIRRGLSIKKVGHAGTLDPLATGVLVICLGSATRLSEYAMNSTKCYQAIVHLGVETTTYDAEGEATKQRDIGHITPDMVNEALSVFIGEIDQLPPLYSAIKKDGRKLYEIARSGQTVELTPRRVTIHSIEMRDWQPPRCVLEITCSAGTYIRSLAHDLGLALGVGAHLAGLVRTASGLFTLERSASLDALLDNPDWTRFVLSSDTAVLHLPRVDLDPVDEDHVRHGRSPRSVALAAEGFARAYAADGALLALLQADDGFWKPHKVFLGEE
ncbi:MAG: tRNA pseudouridine(55) synthase TruB [bacterium]|nr:tRNA pseudouridine(55) synthase TruB [bacterium]